MSVTSPSDSGVSQLPPYPVRRFTVEEYHRLGESGLLSEDDQVELLEGWIVPKIIRNPTHDVAVGLVDAALRSRLPEEWVIRVQSAITTRDSEPEPDLAVVRGPIRRHAKHHPGPADVALVVEVADTSLDRDRKKARIYAGAGIGKYWIVNLAEARIEVCSRPSRSNAADDSAEYTENESREAGDEVPLVIENTQIAMIPVSELLP